MTTTNHLCNLCGLSLVLEPNSGFSEIHGLVNCKVSGGYDSTPGNGSGALDDTHQYKFSLCEFCLDWLFIQFKIPVEISDYMGTGSNSQKLEWVSAENRVSNDDWRGMKKEFFEEFKKRNRARMKKEDLH